MLCPNCSAEMIPTDYRGVQIEECPACLGRWFDRDELRQAKDRTDEALRWLDFDPFARAADAPTEGRQRPCPVCRTPMGVIAYQASGVLMDACREGHGVFLDHGEFEKIVAHLESEVTAETAAEYRQEAVRQFAQVMTGHEGRVSELRDFFAVLSLLEQRLGVEHPRVAKAIEAIYLGSPFK